MSGNGSKSREKERFQVPPLKFHKKCPYGHPPFPPRNKLPEIEKTEITIKPACAEYCGVAVENIVAGGDAMEMSIQLNLPDADDPRRDEYLQNLFDFMETMMDLDAEEGTGKNGGSDSNKSKPYPQTRVTLSTTSMFADSKK